MGIEAGPIPFAEAIDFFRGKVNLPTARWDDLRHGGHVRAFSVAGMMRDDWLAEVRTAMEKARESGGGLAEFQKDFEAFVDRSGWKFNARGKSEADRRAWRARIIYKTNARVSYMAGRYKQMTDPDVLKYRPFWQYKHSGAEHPRKMHLSWDGLVLSADDPWWKVHFPPNGWGCGCDVIGLNKRQLAALGKSRPDQAPDGQIYDGRDPRTGETEIRYPGIDRGWEYNPGKEWLHGLVPSELREPLPAFGNPSTISGSLPAMPAPKIITADRLLTNDLPEQDYVDRFLEEFGIEPGEAGFFRDKSGGLITIGQSMFEQRMPDQTVTGLKSTKRGRGAFTLLLADAIKEPDEIWVGWTKVSSGLALRRSYLKWVLLPDGKPLLVRFEWSAKGWFATTGFDTKGNYIEKSRVGALLYQRAEAKPHIPDNARLSADLRRASGPRSS